MHIASLRLLPILTILAIAAVMFWGLVTVFGSEPDSSAQSTLTTNSLSDLPHVPLDFPEVSRPALDPLPPIEPSPEPSPDQAKAVSKSTPTATKTKKPHIPTNGPNGASAQGADGDPTIGPDVRTGGDSTDPVGDINDVFEQPKPPPPPPPPPPDPEVDDDDSGSTDVDNVNSGNSGNNGANGESSTATDNGDSERGDD